MTMLDVLGQKFEVEGDPDDDYFRHAHDQMRGFENLVAIAAQLGKDSVILDVGANIGLSTIAMAIAAPQATIISLEPSPKNFEFLCRNVRQFGTRIKTRQVAASNESGTLNLHLSRVGAWSHVVGAGHLEGHLPVVQVEAVRLDDLMGETRPAMIKIDVEGHEPEVISGAKRVIESTRPTVCMEFNSWTLNAYGGHSPAAFASAIFKAFDVEGWSRHIDFLNRNLCVDKGLTDIVMRLRDGGSVPTLEEMSFSPAARAILDKLREEAGARSSG
ncbi:MAG: FkbM family methyltransferase [Stellaceae bacterium]